MLTYKCIPILTLSLLVFLNSDFTKVYAVLEKSSEKFKDDSNIPRKCNNFLQEIGKFGRQSCDDSARFSRFNGTISDFKNEKIIQNSILENMKGLNHCPQNSADLQDRMVKFLSFLDEHHNIPKFFDSHLRQNRINRHQIYMKKTSPILPTPTPVPVSISKFDDFNIGADKINTDDAILFDELEVKSPKTALPTHINKNVQTVYQDIFKTLDHVRESEKDKPIKVNILVPGNNDLSNAAYVALQI